jgi:hypothetical protein
MYFVCASKLLPGPETAPRLYSRISGKRYELVPGNVNALDSVPKDGSFRKSNTGIVKSPPAPKAKVIQVFARVLNSPESYRTPGLRKGALTQFGPGKGAGNSERLPDKSEAYASLIAASSPDRVKFKLNCDVVTQAGDVKTDFQCACELIASHECALDYSSV